MKPILVTASTPLELSLLTEQLRAARHPPIGHLPVSLGRIGATEVVLAVTGIGKVNAACAATLLLERITPQFLVNTGCGGATAGSGLSVGELAIASEENFPDEGVETPQGWRGLDLIGIPVFEGDQGRIFNRLPLNAPLADRALACARREGFAVGLGPFHTVSTCSGTAVRGAELLRRYPAICENMEGGALAQVALVYGVPFLEVRGISNLVEDRDLAGWDVQGAVAQAQRFLLRFLQVCCSDESVS